MRASFLDLFWRLTYSSGMTHVTFSGGVYRGRRRNSGCESHEGDLRAIVSCMKYIGAAAAILIFVIGLMGAENWHHNRPPNGTKQEALSLATSQPAQITGPIARSSSESAALSTPRPTASITSNELIGTWDGIGSFEFRSDGTYAERSNGNLVSYSQKCNQDTGECGAPQYPETATSTGRWLVEDFSLVKNESVYVDIDATTSVSSLITEPIPSGTFVLKLYTGGEDDNPEYLGAVLSSDANRLELFYLLGGGAYGDYERIPS